MVQKYPALFSYSVESNLEPKMDFFIEVLGEEAMVLVEHNPSLLGYSLENRLKPRYRDTARYGLKLDARLLRRMGQYTDEKWCDLIDGQ